MERQQKEWNQLKHEPSKRTDVYNLIRSVLEKDLKVPADLKKPLINLGLGEPSKANGFELPEVINEAMIESIKGETANGYTMSSGTLDARKAIVKKFSNPEFPFTVDDVVLSFGCSGAIYNAVSALCEEGDNILVPRPGFPLCYPISQNLNINLKYYDLLPEQGWEIDLNSLKSQIDENTKAILVNNPSNPCGSCFTKAHSLEILAVANEYKVPIISDEVYYGLAYGEGSEFNSFGNLTKDVPIICCSSISKIYCLPGWRLGWSIVYNNHGYFDHVIQNLHKHAMIQLHPNSLVQQALPRILGEVGEDHFTTLKNKLKEAAECAFNRLSQIRGLQPIKPSAAMYMMIKISLDEFCDIEDDVDFCKKMLHEESILAFPAQCFFAKDAFRIVICQSTKNIEEFADRLQDFCQAHYKRTAPLVQDQ
ncbi:tyrosine aminotransferase [Stylonychia lemnae]|uniref:Tyrosine aminotransferase n=1 Tax=Stylonychia lemnae TaxID=5949 RepID=A0A078AEB5_STYLE|nr:tyrosine aminotransferase [Stylonychia lemnae]|eukprot:CDW80599.1 tyrosine aminotransferase [Stylonychia lemnae]